jgi:hypothetical protein
MSLRLLGAQAACVTSGGSTFENAPEVRLFNPSAAEVLVTVTNAAGASIGTFSLEAGAVEVISKYPDDKVLAASVVVLGTPVTTRR